MVDDGWNTHLILGFCPYFQGRTVSFRECTLPKLTAKWENNPKPKRKGIISQPPFLKGFRFRQWIVLHLPSKLGDMIQFDKYSSIGLKPQTRYSCFWCMGGGGIVCVVFSECLVKTSLFSTITGKVIAFAKWHVICVSASHFVYKFPYTAIYVWWTASVFQVNFVVSKVLYPPNLDKVFLCKWSKTNWVDSGYLRLTSIPQKISWSLVIRVKLISPLLTYPCKRR